MKKTTTTKLFEEITAICDDITAELETIKDTAEAYEDAEGDEDRDQAESDAWAAIDEIVKEVGKLKEKQAELDA